MSWTRPDMEQSGTLSAGVSWPRTAAIDWRNASRGEDDGKPLARRVRPAISQNCTVSGRGSRPRGRGGSIMATMTKTKNVGGRPCKLSTTKALRIVQAVANGDPAMGGGRGRRASASRRSPVAGQGAARGRALRLVRGGREGGGEGIIRGGAEQGNPEAGVWRVLRASPVQKQRG